MILEPNPEETAEFYKHLRAEIETQLEAERQYIKMMNNFYGIDVPDDLFIGEEENLLSEPLQADEMSPQEYEEATEIPITEEELFHIIREQEIKDNEKVQY